MWIHIFWIPSMTFQSRSGLKSVKCLTESVCRSLTWSVLPHGSALYYLYVVIQFLNQIGLQKITISFPRTKLRKSLDTEESATKGIGKSVIINNIHRIQSTTDWLFFNISRLYFANKDFLSFYSHFCWWFCTESFGFIGWENLIYASCSRSILIWISWI